MYLHTTSRRPLSQVEVDKMLAMGRQGSKLQVGSSNDFISELTRMRNACMPGGCGPAAQSQPTYGQGGAGPQGNPQGAVNCRPCWRVTYVGNNGASTAAAAVVVVTITPAYDFYAFRMILAGAANWTVSSVKIQLTEYLGSAGIVSGSAFSDAEESTGRMILGLANPTNPILVTLTNISAGALIPNVTFQGHVAAVV